MGHILAHHTVPRTTRTRYNNNNNTVPRSGRRALHHPSLLLRLLPVEVHAGGRQVKLKHTDIGINTGTSISVTEQKIVWKPLLGTGTFPA